MFSCEFCEISKNPFFTEHLWTTASDFISFTATLLKWGTAQRRIQGEAQGARAPPFFCNHLVFLQSLYFNIHTLNTLTYVYTNTIETCFTLSHLLFGRQLLYSS